MGRFHHSPPTSPAGRTLEVFTALESRWVGICPTVEGTQLHKLRKNLVQGECDDSFWSHPCGQTEFVHFREVRFCRTVGTRPHHEASNSIRSADDNRHRHFLYADGTRPSRRRTDSRTESRARRSQTSR